MSVSRASALERLLSFNPCFEAEDFIDSLPKSSPNAIWKKCERADWMLWLCGKLSGESESDSRRKLVLCACECARTALKHVPAGEERPIKAIETAERWARKEGVTLEDVDAAGMAAEAALASTDAAHAAHAAHEAHATRAAVRAAVMAARAAARTTWPAYAASRAADMAAWSGGTATRLDHLKLLADIVMKHYRECPLTLET